MCRQPVREASVACRWVVHYMHISSDVPAPGPFPTGSSAVEVLVRERVFDGGDDEEGEPIAVELALMARFVPC